MKQGSPIEEFIEQVSFWFEVKDYNPVPNKEGIEEMENKEGTKGDPYHRDYEPTWHRKSEWDDDFQFLWRWAENHGIYDGGEWQEIPPDCFRDEWNFDFIPHPYRYKVSSESFFRKETTDSFSRLIQALEGTSEGVGCHIETKSGAYSALDLDDLKKKIKEEC